MGSEVRRLERFVGKAMQSGHAKEEIDQTLRAAGWPLDQIKSALAAYADVPFSIPVPRPQVSLSARDTFFYLLMFFALYFGMWHLGDLLFSFINQYVSDPSDSNAYHGWDQQRWSTAAIMIAWPIFLFMSYLIRRDLLKDPAKRLAPVRRWLTYMTLFIASTALIIDATSLVYTFLGGATTLRFLLKVSVVAVISGTAFGYYLSDIRKDEIA